MGAWQWLRSCNCTHVNVERVRSGLPWHAYAVFNSKQSNAKYSSALYWCRVPAGAVDTILSYCHNNLADQTLLDLLPYLHEKGVGVISASFSSMGLLRKEVRLSHICQSAFLGSPVTGSYSPVTAVTPCPRAAAKHHLSQVLWRVIAIYCTQVERCIGQGTNKFVSYCRVHQTGIQPQLQSRRQPPKLLSMRRQGVQI